MLIPGRPIGLLIYNNSEFMQLPWETIVKKYRNLTGNKQFGTLQECAHDFLSFIGSPDSGLYSDEQYEITFGLMAQYYMTQIAFSIDRAVKKKIDDSAKKISRKEISEIIDHWIHKYHDKWEKYENDYADEEIVKLGRRVVP